MHPSLPSPGARGGTGGHGGQLTNGRVEFGTGRSNAYEQMGLGIDPRETRERWEESISMLPKIWQSDEFSYEGKFWSVPSRRVLPKPYQKPHPRMYLACTQTDSFRFAAEKGIGVLSSASYATSILAEHVKTYRENIKNAEPVGAFVNDFWGNNVHAFCGPNNQEARELCAESMKTFFGPDKPYIAGRIGAYEELLQAWGGVPDHLQSDFGRWLRQSDEAHQEQAEKAGLSPWMPAPARPEPPWLSWTPIPCVIGESSSVAIRKAASRPSKCTRTSGSTR